MISDKEVRYIQTKIATDNKTYDEWKKRILEFAKTDSEDLATFPIFYTFLENLAKSKPEFAFELVRQNAESLKPVLK